MPGALSSRPLREVRNRWAISTIGLAAMTDAANLDGIGIGTNEEKAVVTNPQAEFVFSSEDFHVAHA